MAQLTLKRDVKCLKLEQDVEQSFPDNTWHQFHDRVTNGGTK
jgi:hypothetical protein